MSFARHPRHFVSLLVILLPSVFFLRLAIQAADKPAPDVHTLYDVRIERDISYYTGAGADKIRHKLDLYLPKDKKEFPVLMFVHGGAWIFGDKSFFGIHEAFGRMFARQGIAAVCINYRLSPAVMHPEHVKDVARAFAWTRENIKQYGGRPDQIFLCGHSAGGHLVSLLGTDETYLKAYHLSHKDIKGVMSISGVYGFPDNMFTEIFGQDPEVRKKACPVNQACAGCPPFLIIWADQDFPFCDVGSRQFCRALQNKNVQAETLEIKKRNHLDILGKAKSAADPCAEALLTFIGKHTEQ